MTPSVMHMTAAVAPLRGSHVEKKNTERRWQPLSTAASIGTITHSTYETDGDVTGHRSEDRLKGIFLSLRSALETSRVGAQ